MLLKCLVLKVLSHFCASYHCSNVCRQKLCHGHGVHCHNGVVRWKISKSVKVVGCILVSEILTFQLLPSNSRSRSWRTFFAMLSFDHKYIKICKNSPTHFALAFNRFRNINESNVLAEKVGNGHGVQFSQWRHSIENIKFLKVVGCIFLS